MKMRKFIPLLLVIWPYLVLGILGILPNDENFNYGLAVLLVCIATAIVYIMNVIHVCKDKTQDAKELAFMDMLIKLIHIPFYLFVFLIGLIAFVLMVVPIFAFIAPVLAIMLAIIDFFLMLTSSAYGICALIRARKKGTISTMFMVVHIFMHLCFVLDIISAIVVFIKLRKADSNAI